jgi:hypothetical protein
MKMNPIRIANRQTRKSLKIGIIDLITKRPLTALYARIMNPNFASIMPQVVAVWAEEMGHEVHLVTYTGFEDLQRELPHDIDVLFVCAFTQAAFLAYSISNLFRKQNVVTVLGGPHARSYAEDARNYFDYVVGFADKTLINDLLQDCSQHLGNGVMLSAPQQPNTLPGVRERWKFIRQTLDKTDFFHIVPMIGSLGCPYKCSFCVDSVIDYQPLPYDQIREDLVFLQTQFKQPSIGWHDPNFGVRFDDYMGVIEEAVKPGTVRFAAESSLSLLSEPHLQRLQRNGFVAMLPGIESWFDCNDKSKQGKNFGVDKVKSVAEHINMIAHYIPYVQTNFVLGLDVDAGPQPFELTKRFLDLAPAAFPAYSMFTAFGNSAPLNLELQRDGRVLDVPFHFLDNNSALNVRLKNYSTLEFYNHLVGLMRYSFAPRAIWRRFQANKNPVPRWMNFVRAVSSEGRGRYRQHVKMRHRMATDREFIEFFSGQSAVPPSYYHNLVKEQLGSFYEHLPAGILDYLTRGRPDKDSTNGRLSSPVEQENFVPLKNMSAVDMATA